MVTRKPVAPSVDTAQAVPNPAIPASMSAPPYPTTPTQELDRMNLDGHAHDAAGFDLIDMDEHGHKPTRRDSDVSSHGTWDSDDSDGEEQEGFVEVPKPLNFRPSQQDLTAGDKQKETKQNELPAILRPGNTGGATVRPRKSQEMRQYDEEAQENPWRLEDAHASPQTHERSEDGISSKPTSGVQLPPALMINAPAASTQASPSSSHIPPIPSNAPPAPPSSAPPPVPLPAAPQHNEPISPTQPPVDAMGKLSVTGKAPVTAEPTFETAEVLPVPQKGQPPFPPVTSSVTSPETPIFPSNNPWRTQSPPERQQESYFVPPGPPPPKSPISPIPYQEPQYDPPPGPPPTSAESHYAPPPGPPPGRTGQLIDHEEAHTAPAQPPRPPPIDSHPPPSRPSDPVPETPRTRATRQRNEHYQIKHVNWLDKTQIRRSPILTQNANGPCPLLALVNALILSTPSNVNTALTETLRTREQVSLGLLLDAVFDELMSGRRGETAHELPDVSELYSFLLALHTGMNVNPRFVDDDSNSRSHGHTSTANGMHFSQATAGCFEATKEMRLYSTFSVPLIHGWIPARSSPAYAAFERSAQTFEDAQNIQFVGLELEDKERNEGLSREERSSLQDIQTIKQFLGNWPTQLTETGLETISDSLKPGEIAILFRNDHFSTLYKEPTHGALMTLVTDAGYGSHEEIVWESLVDVNGAASEMFSGDFRVVSHSEDARLNQGNSGGGQSGWQTVPSRSRPGRRPTEDDIPPPLPGPRPSRPSSSPVDEPIVATLTDPQRSASEQEDHDLALALQLQEEEEDRHRQDEARRRREQELSEQFLENEERPAVPPRRSNGSTSSPNLSSSTANPSTPRPRPGRAPVSRPGDASDPDAPPTYEQAASDQVYRPAGSTAPPTSHGNPLNAYDALRRQQTAYASQSTASLLSGNNAGVAAPSYSATAGPVPGGRRRGDTNRVRRRSSGMGTMTNNGGAGPSRVGGAATVRDAEEDKCTVM